MRVTLSPLAERDLESIGDYIAAKDPARAVQFVGRLRAQCAALAKMPKGYRLRPELGRGIRSCACGSYVLFFSVGKARLTVVRILHGAMDIPVRFPTGSE